MQTYTPLHFGYSRADNISINADEHRSHSNNASHIQ